jgi:hypothetical protein
VGRRRFDGGMVAVWFGRRGEMGVIRRRGGRRTRIIVDGGRLDRFAQSLGPGAAGGRIGPLVPHQTRQGQPLTRLDPDFQGDVVEVGQRARIDAEPPRHAEKGVAFAHGVDHRRRHLQHHARRQGVGRPQPIQVDQRAKGRAHPLRHIVDRLEGLHLHLVRRLQGRERRGTQACKSVRLSPAQLLLVLGGRMRGRLGSHRAERLGLDMPERCGGRRRALVGDRRSGLSGLRLDRRRGGWRRRSRRDRIAGLSDAEAPLP